MKARFSRVESGEMFEVDWRRWYGDGTDNDVMWVTWEGLQGVVVAKGKFEVRWLVVGPEVVVGRTWDDLGVDVIGCDSRLG